MATDDLRGELFQYYVQLLTPLTTPPHYPQASYVCSMVCRGGEISQVGKILMMIFEIYFLSLTELDCLMYRDGGCWVLLIGVYCSQNGWLNNILFLFIFVVIFPLLVIGK